MEIPIELLSLDIAKQAGVALYMARADLIHPLASGNKYYKLKPHFEYVKKHKINQIVSFGGAFSNHIHALALMSKQLNIDSVGIIRGEAEYANNATLSDAKRAGMQLHFVDRKTYKKRYDPDYLASLAKDYPDALIIPEGGSSQLAIQGCKQLADQINQQIAVDVLTLACGTGATLAGVISGLSVKQRAIGYAVLKDTSLAARIARFVQSADSSKQSFYLQQADYGGYAKLTKTLLDLILNWLTETGILLDPVYTGKLAMRLQEQIKTGEFDSGTSICMIHTGGLQGWRGMQNQVEQLGGKAAWKTIEQALNRSLAEFK